MIDLMAPRHLAFVLALNIGLLVNVSAMMADFAHQSLPGSNDVLPSIAPLPDSNSFEPARTRPTLAQAVGPTHPAQPRPFVTVPQTLDRSLFESWKGKDAHPQTLDEPPFVRQEVRPSAPNPSPPAAPTKPRLPSQEHVGPAHPEHPPVFPVSPVPTTPCRPRLPGGAANC